jgi:hypothetical protein
MQLRKEHVTPFHEFIMVLTQAGYMYRVDRGREGLFLDALREQGAPPVDTIALLRLTSLEELDGTSYCAIELRWGPNNLKAIDLKLVLDICFQIHKNSGKRYKLLTHNCYFFAQTIIMIAVRKIVSCKLENVLKSDTLWAVTESTAMMVTTQRVLQLRGGILGLKMQSQLRRNWRPQTKQRMKGSWWKRLQPGSEWELEQPEWERKLERGLQLQLELELANELERERVLQLQQVRQRMWEQEQEQEQERRELKQERLELKQERRKLKRRLWWTTQLTLEQKLTSELWMLQREELELERALEEQRERELEQRRKQQRELEQQREQERELLLEWEWERWRGELEGELTQGELGKLHQQLQRELHQKLGLELRHLLGLELGNQLGLTLEEQLGKQLGKPLGKRLRKPLEKLLGKLLEPRFVLHLMLLQLRQQGQFQQRLQKQFQQHLYRSEWELLWALSQRVLVEVLELALVGELEPGWDKKCSELKTLATKIELGGMWYVKQHVGQVSCLTYLIQGEVADQKPWGDCDE